MNWEFIINGDAEKIEGAWSKKARGAGMEKQRRREYRKTINQIWL